MEVEEKKVVEENTNILNNGISMDTNLLLFDGTYKLCYQITEKDLLMGDDCQPRHIVSKKKLKPEECKLYRVTQNKGINYVINQDNYISLKLSRLRHNKDTVKVGGREIAKNEILDIRLSDYLKLSKTAQMDFKAYKVGIDCKTQPLLCDPYIMGLWFMDASVSENELTISDIPILEECFNIVSEKKMTLDYLKGNRYALNYEDVTKNFNTNVLEKLKLLKTDKFIPLEYKINSRENRLRLLAGMIDCQGFSNNNCYEMTLKNEVLADDIVFLCNSLGLYCSKTNQKKKTHYYRIIISGDLSEVPVINEKKKIPARKQIKNVLHTGVTIQPLSDINSCYEIVVDGNGRFLTSDFTVLHC